MARNGPRTGKELIARAIHQHSDRSLVRVNCGSIPRELFESEFFGRVKGAFTGALADRVGRFPLADEGTLFFDEVGEIPLELQSKLLRVLQEGEFERLGEDRTRQVNVRIIAATNRDLKNDVAQKRFRQDLYYRLSVFPVQVAPLRERKEDIGLLADHLMKVICKRLGLQPMQLKQKHILELQQHDWSGNVRELQNVIERAVITSRDRQLVFEMPESAYENADRPSKPEPFQDTQILTVRQIKLLEKENIVKALKKMGSKIHGPGGAAALLQMPPTTLASKIKTLDLKPHEKS